MKENCIFCKIIKKEIPSRILYEDDDFIIILDNGPATRGHAILIPKEHFENIFTMNEEIASKLFPVLIKVSNAMKKVLNCDELNLLQNNGRQAGQTVFHFHLHLIPRYKEDGVSFQWDSKEYNEEEYATLVNEIASLLS